MATDRIDSLYDLAAIEAQQKATQALVNKTIEDIKKAKELSIDFNVNTKSLADYNNKIKDLEAQLNKVQKSSDAAVRSSILLEKQKQAEAATAEKLAKQQLAETRAREANEKAAQKEAAAIERTNKAKNDLSSRPVESIPFEIKTGDVIDDNASNQRVNQLEREEAALASAAAAESDYTNEKRKATKATTEDFTPLQQNIILRDRLKSKIADISKSQKEDSAALKAGTINREQYNQKLVESQARLTVYKSKVQELDRVIKEDIILEGRAGDAYKQLSAEYNKAALAAKNYQINLGATHPTTIAAVKNAKGLSDQLKTIDNAVGQNTRNVGNYSSALSGAFSKAWGFLRTAANIIPGLGIGGLIGGIVASMGSLIASVSSAAKPFNELKEANDALNDSMEQTEYQATIAEVKTLKTEIQLAKDGFIDKDLVVKQYNDTIGKTTGFVKNLDEAEQALNKNAEAYIRFTLLKAAANEVQQRAAKELVEAEIQNQKDLARIARIGTRDRPEDKEGAAISKFIGRGEENLREAEQRAAAKRVKGLEDIANKFLAEAAAISKQFNFNFFEVDPTKEKKKIEKKGKDILEANRKAQFEILKAQLDLDKEFDLRRANDEQRTFADRVNNLISYGEDSQRLIEEQARFDLGAAELTATERKKIELDKNNALIRLGTELNDKLKKLAQDNFKTQTDQLPVSGKISKDLQKILDDFAKAQKKAIEDAAANAEKLKKAFKDAFESLATELSGLFFDVFQNAIEREKNAVQDQIDLLEQQKQKDIEVANQTITNAQEKADAIAVIEARAASKRQQLELRQRQLDQQKARFEKANAVTRIIQETAIAVISSFKTDPTGILAAVIGAIGAAQLVRVLAQPIPRYAEGTENHKGGLMYVGDGGKSEGVVMPDGSVYKSPAVATLVNAPVGTKVYSDYNKMMLNATMTKTPVFNIKTQDNTTAVEMRKVGRDIVKAVKNIPQPHLSTDGAWTKAMRSGSSFRTYLNKHL